MWVGLMDSWALRRENVVLGLSNLQPCASCPIPPLQGRPGAVSRCFSLMQSAWEGPSAWLGAGSGLRPALGALS